jgi:hypothetical protein
MTSNEENVLWTNLVAQKWRKNHRDILSTMRQKGLGENLDIQHQIKMTRGRV